MHTPKNKKLERDIKIMDKYIKAFCKQNPNIKLICGNKECKHEFTTNTMEVYALDMYKYTCEICGKETTYVLKNDFVKQLKAMGVVVK